LAFRRGLVADGALWMEMIENRKLTVHTYNESTAIEVASLIRKKYFGLFLNLRDRLEEIQTGGQSTLF
jgi:hypothetical protein